MKGKKAKLIFRIYFAISFSRESSWPRNWTWISCIAGRFFTDWTISLCQLSSVQSLSHVWLFVNPWITAHQASLSISNSRNSLKLMSIESVMPSSHLILCCPLLLLPLIPPSIRVFSKESTLCMRWPKYWSFSLSISPSNEHAGLISFRTDWLDLFAVQGTLKSLLQHHSSKASILQCSAFFYSPTLTSIWNPSNVFLSLRFLNNCITSPFYRWVNQGSEKCPDLSKVT